METKTASEKETQKIGIELSKSLKVGDVVCLYGELGAGKTVLVKGIAQGLGVKKRILSPTFVLMRTYPVFLRGKKEILLHLDLFRIDDFSSLGLNEIFESRAIKIIEWAEKLENALPAKRIDVKINKVDEKTRKITIRHF